MAQMGAPSFWRQYLLLRLPLNPESWAPHESTGHGRRQDPGRPHPDRCAPSNWVH
ncbi:unnamed protein product [Chondrus crispus]|uniref:Uncharacterized protein n=1 Tax=Chondrus crispus TaxID=2769 RepID=R7QRT9_CHOCR|nr:unnamed protein product [Chondrus crispus]CDF41212.1 unnamed protein product [Chondrus crispus]|eukprot:XP_005711506.1 unnamed protein product [Chondrus crispus]